MPRRTKATSNDSSQNNLTDLSRGPHGGEPAASATTQANQDIDPFMATLSSGAPNPLRSTVADHTLHSSRPSKPAPAASSQRPTLLHGQVRDKLDISPENKQTRKELLHEAFFADWNDDASSADLGNPDDMQKKDPLGTQIWKLYSKTKTQLPNQERMENLTWRMMAMNLKRKQNEQARYV